MMTKASNVFVCSSLLDLLTNKCTRGSLQQCLSGYLNGGSKEWGRGMRDSPGYPNSFDFMPFAGKFGKIVYLRPPGELVSPPRGNPGSATAVREVKLTQKQINPKPYS